MHQALIDEINSREGLTAEIVDTTYKNGQAGHPGLTIPRTSIPGFAELLSGSLTSIIRDFWWHMITILGVLCFVHFVVSLLGSLLSIIKRIAGGK